MRLWSLHPSQLDVRGLVALWREGLLARAVLRGETKGYKNHPQLARFKARKNPVAAIDAYLHAVADEADARGYHFARPKLGPRRRLSAAPVARGQLAYEWTHLLAKLKRREPARWRRQSRARPRTHPGFRTVAGGVADWERTTSTSRR